MTEITIGIDVSKDRLDVHRLPQGDAEDFANTRAGVNELMRWIGTEPVSRIVFEPTGRVTATWNGASAMLVARWSR